MHISWANCSHCSIYGALIVLVVSMGNVLSQETLFGACVVSLT